MIKNNVTSLESVRCIKNIEKSNLFYKEKISKMKKDELLDEMQAFQEKRTLTGALTLNMMIQGKILFHEIEKRASTKELKELASSYCKHLHHELKALTQINLQKIKNFVTKPP